jgi:hypothetical protein
MKTIILVLLMCCFILATQWQPAEPLYGIDIGAFNFNSDNTIMYGDKWHDGYWSSDICYYIWNGSNWVWGDWIKGDVNSTDYDVEPFITYDGQHLYFTRWLYDGQRIYVADWDGSEFNNSRPLGAQINNGDNRFPSLTQDGMKLYYTGGSGDYFKIFESTWSGSDWGAGTLLPDAVNSSGNRYYVTITPDGNEIYFTGTNITSQYWLAFSRKVGGIWQPWQYCDYNINPYVGIQIYHPAFTYADYSSQYMYFARNTAPYVYRSLRSPVSVEPASLGQIKANYAK